MLFRSFLLSSFCSHFITYYLLSLILSFIAFFFISVLLGTEQRRSGERSNKSAFIGKFKAKKGELDDKNQSVREKGVGSVRDRGW